MSKLFRCPPCDLLYYRLREEQLSVVCLTWMSSSTKFINAKCLVSLCQLCLFVCEVWYCVVRTSAFTVRDMSLAINSCPSTVSVCVWSVVLCCQDLGIHCERHVTGYQQLSVYCPYWMINKTQRNLSYKVTWRHFCALSYFLMLEE